MWHDVCMRCAVMAKKDQKPSGRDPGVTVRVPLETVKILREKAKGLGTHAMLTEEEVVYRLALRAVEIGARSPKLTAV